MAISFLEALKRIFIPVERDDNEPQEQESKEQKPQGSQPAQDTQPVAVHVVQVQEEVVEQLIAHLQALHGKEDMVQGLKLWTTDTVTAQALKDNDFNKMLRLRLDDAGFERTILTGHELIVQQAPDGARALCHGVSFTLGDEAKQTGPVMRITLSEVSGYGSLAQPSYVLDTGAKTKFRLGRGPVGSRDSHWVNDVAVGNECATVSSQQALIMARDGHFYLQATPSGCRDTGGSATKVISGDSVHELTDTSQLHRLHNGDVLEFGGSVRISVSLT